MCSIYVWYNLYICVCVCVCVCVMCTQNLFMIILWHIGRVYVEKLSTGCKNWTFERCREDKCILCTCPLYMYVCTCFVDMYMCMYTYMYTNALFHSLPLNETLIVLLYTYIILCVLINDVQCPSSLIRFFHLRIKWKSLNSLRKFFIAPWQQ